MYSEAIAINKTTKLLYRGLFKLLKVNNFNQITVNDICKESLVSRSTFYSYFQDKYHLVLFCLDQERRALELVKGEDIFKNLVSFLDRIKEKNNIYKNLLIGESNVELQKMIIGRFKELTEHNLKNRIETEDELNILSVLYSTGFTGTIIWWIENDFHLDVKVLAKNQYDILMKM